MVLSIYVIKQIECIDEKAYDTDECDTINAVDGVK